MQHHEMAKGALHVGFHSGFDLDGYACACMFTHFDHDASRDGLL
jgi:hypothetical protein